MLLYRFRQFDDRGYALAGLRNSALWCSSRTAFNDPFEFRYALERHPADVDALYDHWLATYPQWRGQLARKAVPLMALEVLNDYIDRIGVCCFGENPANIQMWSYYAGGHSGFCLGFDFSAVSGSLSRRSIFKVAYANQTPRFSLKVFQQKPIPLYEAALPLLTTKHTSWSHENEWRYLHTEANTDVHYRPEFLKEIIVGAKATRENVSTIRRLCDDLGLDVRFREALLVPQEYEMLLRDC